MKVLDAKKLVAKQPGNNWTESVLRMTAPVSIRLYKKLIIIVIHITGAVGIQDLLIGFQHQASLGIEDIRPAGSPEHFTDGYDRVFAVGYEYSFRRVYRRFRTVDRDQAGWHTLNGIGVQTQNINSIGSFFWCEYIPFFLTGCIIDRVFVSVSKEKQSIRWFIFSYWSVTKET